MHTFTGPGTFSVSLSPTPANNEISYMVVAGGGGVEMVARPRLVVVEVQEDLEKISLQLRLQPLPWMEQVYYCSNKFSNRSRS